MEDIKQKIFKFTYIYYTRIYFIEYEKSESDISEVTNLYHRLAVHHSDKNGLYIILYNINKKKYFF